MAKYRPIFTRIWKDPDFEDLDPESKLIFIYLCTNELTTESGIYPISLKTISNETGIPLQTVSNRFANGLETDGKPFTNDKIKNILYDEQSKYVFVVKFRKYNKGGSPLKIEKSILKDFETSNCTYLWNNFINEYPDYKDKILTVGKPIANGLQTVPASVTPNPNPNPNPKIALFTSVNKAPVTGGHFSDRVGDYAEPIIMHCREILKLPTKKGRQIFNPFQWVQFQTNENMHPGAILETVEALANPKYWNGIRAGPWEYATKIIKTKNGNWNERDHIAESKEFKQLWISPEIQQLIKDIGS
ncbi:MAG: hypothetical protein SWH54_01295 [Thermodesulfobacteriota bacterium]|nr:hypothetical protein [Thermodesulfobacteriota bacterium]